MKKLLLFAALLSLADLTARAQQRTAGWDSRSYTVVAPNTNLSKVVIGNVNQTDNKSTPPIAMTVSNASAADFRLRWGASVTATNAGSLTSNYFVLKTGESLSFPSATHNFIPPVSLSGTTVSNGYSGLLNVVKFW